LRRRSHNPTSWLFFCGPHGIRIYGDSRSEVDKFLGICWRAMRQRGTLPEVTP